MAERKKRTLVLKRDSDFTAKIGAGPSAFNVPKSLTSLPEVQGAPKTEKPEPETPVVALTKPDKDDAVLEAASKETPAKAKKAPSTPVQTKQAKTLYLYIYLQADLAKRAEAWAKAVNQPTIKVVRHCFNQLRPALLEEFQTIKAADVTLGRIERAGLRLQVPMQFTPAEIEAMKKRLDPAGFGNLTGSLNNYMRNRFAVVFDKTLTQAGY